MQGLSCASVTQFTWCEQSMWRYHHVMPLSVFHDQGLWKYGACTKCDDITTTSGDFHAIVWGDITWPSYQVAIIWASYDDRHIPEVLVHTCIYVLRGCIYNSKTVNDMAPVMYNSFGKPTLVLLHGFWREFYCLQGIGILSANKLMTYVVQFTCLSGCALPCVQAS